MTLRGNRWFHTVDAHQLRLPGKDLATRKSHIIHQKNWTCDDINIQLRKISLGPIGGIHEGIVKGTQTATNMNMFTNQQPNEEMRRRQRRQQQRQWRRRQQRQQRQQRRQQQQQHYNITTTLQPHDNNSATTPHTTTTLQQRYNNATTAPQQHRNNTATTPQQHHNNTQQSQLQLQLLRWWHTTLTKRKWWI